MKRVLLIGATDGIGRCLARVYATRGWYVGVVGRDRGKVEATVESLGAGAPHPAVGVVGDVTLTRDTPRVFAEAVEALGQIDLLIYCAGAAASEDTPVERQRGTDEMLDVNVRGAIHWIEHAVAYFTPLGSGRIAAIGSVAGVRGRKGHPVYGASKAALHTYLEGLRHRLHGTGVEVTTVVPGWVRTRMLPDTLHGSRLAVDADQAAARIARSLDRGRDIVYVPAFWGPIAFALRWMPRWLYKRIAPA